MLHLLKIQNLRDVRRTELEFRLVDQLLHNRRCDDTDEVQSGFVRLHSTSVGGYILNNIRCDAQSR